MCIRDRVRDAGQAVDAYESLEFNVRSQQRLFGLERVAMSEDIQYAVSLSLIHIYCSLTAPAISRSRFLVNTVTSHTGSSISNPTNQR